MADQFFKEQPKSAFEVDVDKLAVEVKNYQEKNEVKNLDSREVIKKTVQQVTGTTSDDAGSKKDDNVLPDYADQASASVKLEVETLIQKALEHGIYSALGEAKNSSPFVLDAFHDALTGKLYDEFNKRGLLK
jgi:hypothetical protein